MLCYSSIGLQEYGTLSLISYDVIKENTSLKITNKMKDKSFKFIFKENYLISNIKEDIFKKVFTLISCENSSEKSFYNYILENKNKAWRIIINLYNKNTECNHKLKTSVFKLNKSKIKFEIFKDSLLPIISVIPDNSPSSEELIKLEK